MEKARGEARQRARDGLKRPHRAQNDSKSSVSHFNFSEYDDGRRPDLSRRRGEGFDALKSTIENAAGSLSAKPGQEAAERGGQTSESAEIANQKQSDGPRRKLDHRIS